MTENKRSRYSGFWESLFVLTGDHTDALLLNYLLYQTQFREDLDQILDEELTTSEDEDRVYTLGWIKKTATQIAEDAMVNASKQTVRRRIERLIDQRVVMEKDDNSDPFRPQKMYRVNITELRTQLAALGYTLQGYERIDDLFKPRAEAEQTESELRAQIAELQNELREFQDELREFQNGTREVQDGTERFQNGTPSIYKDQDTIEDILCGANAPLGADAPDASDLQPPLIVETETDPPTEGIQETNAGEDDITDQPRIVTTRNDGEKPKTPRPRKPRKLYPEEPSNDEIKAWQQALARMLTGDGAKEYWTCSAKLKAQIDNTGAALLKCDPPYTLAELTQWHDELWAKEWPGLQKDGSYQLPTPDKIQDGIGRIRNPLNQQRASINTTKGGDPNEMIALAEGLTLRRGDVQKLFVDWTEHLKHSKQPQIVGAGFATPEFVAFVQAQKARDEALRATVQRIKEKQV